MYTSLDIQLFLGNAILLVGSLDLMWNSQKLKNVKNFNAQNKAKIFVEGTWKRDFYDSDAIIERLS